MLNEKEVAGILQKEEWLPSSQSPFSALKTQKATFNGALDPSVKEAMEWVARPSAVLGLTLSPPVGRDVLWFYLGRRRSPDCDLAGHLIQPPDEHLFNWIPQSQLSELWKEALALPSPEQEGLSYKLSSRGFQALVGALELNREMALQSLLNRKPDGLRCLTAQNVTDTLSKSIEARDPRWLGPVCAALCPLDWDVRDCTWGLKELVQAGLLVEAEEGYNLNRESTILAAQLCAPTLWAAIHAKVLVDEERWETRHLAALGGLSGTWMMEFRNLDMAEPAVTLRQPGPGELIERFELFLKKVRQDSLLLEGVASAPKRCSGCQSPLSPEARFCSHCGASTTEENEAPKAKPKTKKASKKKKRRVTKSKRKRRAKPEVEPEVSAELAPPDVIKSAAAPPKPKAAPAIEAPDLPPEKDAEPKEAAPPALCPNPKCGKEPVPGKKFCTFCGTKL